MEQPQHHQPITLSGQSTYTTSTSSNDNSNSTRTNNNGNSIATTQQLHKLSNGFNFVIDANYNTLQHHPSILSPTLSPQSSFQTPSQFQHRQEQHSMPDMPETSIINDNFGNSAISFTPPTRSHFKSIRT